MKVEIIEAVEKRSKQAALATLAERVPVALNYHDFMKAQPADEWSEHRLFQAKCRGEDDFALGGVSPEGSLNVYGTSPEVACAVAEKCLDATRREIPPLLRSNIETLSYLRDIPELDTHSAVVKPAKHLVARTRQFKAPQGQFKLHRAENNTNDLLLIQQWFDAFNTEMRTSYQAPTGDFIEERGLYLMKDAQGRFVGGLARTDGYANRFWIGRFYIAQPYRRQRLGIEMLNQLAALVKNEVDEFRMQVERDNPAALNFFRAAGFECVGEVFYAKYAF